MAGQLDTMDHDIAGLSPITAFDDALNLSLSKLKSKTKDVLVGYILKLRSYVSIASNNEDSNTIRDIKGRLQNIESNMSMIPVI